MTRAVLDTNVVVSALVWGGKPYELIEAAVVGDLQLATSPTLLEERRAILQRPHLASRLERRKSSIQQAIALYTAFAESIDPPPLPTRTSRDPDDDAVLALAVAAEANFIVSGDKDLLVLGNYADITILTPAQALERVSS